MSKDISPRDQRRIQSYERMHEEHLTERKVLVERANQILNIISPNEEQKDEDEILQEEKNDDFEFAD